MTTNLYLPIGIDDFKEVKTACYYVDKTLFLEDIINSPSSSTFLFTRPRRFGKSLMLSMCKYFFDIKSNSLSLFKNTALVKKDSLYLDYLNKYNVIHLNLKSINGVSYEEFVDTIKFKVSELYADLLNDNTVKYVKSIIDRKCTIIELKQALYYLSKALYQKNKAKSVVLIDEYDTPLENAYVKNYFSEARDFMKDFMGNVLKSNPYLYKAVVTGVTQVAHSSIFSGLNNMMINNIVSNKVEHFGFSEKETNELLNYYNFKGNFDEVKKWYGGYYFQNQEVFNPWSIINFISNIFVFKAYWANTGSYKLLKETVSLLKSEVNNELLDLASGKQINVLINETINYDYLNNNINLYSLLAFGGYLSIRKDDPSDYYSIRIANEEIRLSFNKEIIEGLTNKESFLVLRKIRDSLLSFDVNGFIENITYYIFDRMSYLDLNSEKAYQIVIITITSILMDNALIKSEIEQGQGRCDIYIKSALNNNYAYIIELKYRKNRPSSKELSKSASFALNQIKENYYYSDAKRSGVKKILLLGMALSNKNKEYKFEIIE